MSYAPIVQELVDKMAAEPSFKADLEKSFQSAYNTPGLDVFKELNIHSLDDYVNFMQQYLYWQPSENETGRKVYLRICMFYFVIDQPPILQRQNPIQPDQHAPWTWLSDWLIRYAQEMGRWMDEPGSITPENIKTFYDAKNYHMQDYPVPPGGWKTFNDFFARHIDPAVRPIASPSDDKVIVCPADCTYDGTWPVRDPEADVNSFDVKGLEWTISRLLEDFELGPTFAGGVFTHSFLGPADYHRQHAPVAGRVVAAKVIPGICYLEVGVKESATGDGKVELGMHRYLRPSTDADIPIAHRTFPASGGAVGPRSGGGGDGDRAELEAPDTPGYQFLQARGLVLIDNPVLGLVAVLPIGMAQVSSVVLSVMEGDDLRKGDEISCFHFGGSDIVMVFQKQAHVQFHQVIGTHYNVGTAVATGGVAA